MEEGLSKIRHSVSHLMAQAIQRIVDPDVKLWFWPAIENWFYYDFVFSKKNLLTEDKLKDIQKQMQDIIKESQDFVYIDSDFALAENLFKKLNQPYKLELLKDIELQGNKKIGLYLNTVSSDKKKKLSLSTDEKYFLKYSEVTDFLKDNFDIWDIFVTFVDVCEWPHVDNTWEIEKKSFKLSSIAWAYWKGDEKNDMMTRIYWYAFLNKDELKEYMNFLEDAKKRDHRLLWKQLDLFCFSDLVWAWLPLFTPKWTVLKEALQKKVETLCEAYGFQKVITPHLAKIDLFEISWHAIKFSEELFHVSSKRWHEFAMKPVQCPHQTQIYKSQIRSYKDLPIRYMESEKQYRAEKSWEVWGLSRVYAITVEDWHSFCRVDQIKQEVVNMVNIIKEFYKPLWLRWKHWVSLSLRDYDNLDNYIWNQKDWDKAEKMLEQISEEMNLWAVKCEWEAALYGPKLDFMFKDALWREVQIPTVQLDFATPQKFDLTYIDEGWNEQNPVMLHRAILWSYERLMMLLIEHFAGNFPLWMAPLQTIIVPVSEKYNEYAQEVFWKIKNSGLRVEIDLSEHSLARKIRNAEKKHINYIVVVGQEEKNNHTVAVRNYKTKEQFSQNTEDFLKLLKEEKEKEIL